jgi:hypothetical protein
MEAYLIIGSLIFLILVINHKNTLENTKAFKEASPEKQKRMISERDKKLLEKCKKTTKRHYDHTYDYGDNKSSTSSSSSTSSNSSYTYNNPSTGLPMTTSGAGGVDTSGTSYGH